MKRTHGRSSGCGNAGGWIAAFGLLAAGLAPAETNYPAWWIMRGVLDTNAPPGDYAPVAQGQAKWIAKQAYEELDLLTSATNGVWTNILSLISGFTTNNNYLPLNQGQLKNLAKPFYDFLYEIGWSNAVPPGMSGPYPWTTNTNDDADYAPATLGQLKFVFSFDPEKGDSDGDGLPDWWEMVYFGDLAHSPAEDPDGDGLNNLAEYQNSTDPTKADSDGDGLPDGWEAQYGLSPLRFLPSELLADGDGDGFSAAEEYCRGSSPTSSDPPTITGSVGTIRYYYDVDDRLSSSFLGTEGLAQDNRTPGHNLTRSGTVAP